MKKIFHWLLALINVITALFMLGSFLSRYISPDQSWILAFLGLIFPVLAGINVLLLIYWLILFKKPVWISLISLLLVIPALGSTLKIFKNDKVEDSGNKLSLMTYNVRLFDVFDWTGEENTGARLLEFAGKSEVDIICFQEFMTNNTGGLNIDAIKAKLPANPYSFIEYNYQAYKRKHGLAIFSAYPVLSGYKGHFPGTRNMYIYADVKLPGDTVRIFNAHLESIHLNYQQYNLIDSLNVNQNNRQEIRKIFSNIREAFNKRAAQVAILAEEIEKSPYPVVLCGDFNDTPVSYTYQQLRKNLKDSFSESGHGLATTYNEFIIPLRIDYIMHSEELTTSGHTVMNARFSDHKPVKAWLHFKD